MQHNLKFKEEFFPSELGFAECEVIAFPSPVVNVSGLWFMLLLSLVVLDGLFTYVGISFSSTEYEANILVRSTMELLGVGAGIILSKAVAVLSLFVLWFFRKDIIWIFAAVKGLVFVYFSLAIVPWVYVLTNFLFPLV